jgi:hypothetical protein
MPHFRRAAAALLLAFLPVLAGPALADPAAPAPRIADRTSGFAPANVFVEDDRVRALRRAGTAAGRIVLIVDPTTDKAGTGFLIAPCYAMSALHVFLSEYDMQARSTPGVTYAYTVYYGLGALFGNFEDLTVGRPVVWGNYFAADPVDASQDWIILQLDDCVGDRYGHFEVTPMDLAEARQRPRLQLAGYPRTEIEPYQYVQVDPDCRLYRSATWPMNAAPLWYHDCAMRRGASGSPIFYEDGGRAYAVAIAMGEFQSTEGVLPEYDTRHANIAVPAGNFRTAVEALTLETPDRVAEAQRLLNAIGRTVGEVDGIPGPMTRLAIDGYRERRDLRPGGLITEELLGTLRRDAPAP